MRPSLPTLALLTVAPLLAQVPRIGMTPALKQVADGDASQLPIERAVFTQEPASDRLRHHLLTWTPMPQGGSGKQDDEAPG